MVPRGLKKLLQTSSPCKLVGKGNFKHFRLNGCKLKLKGLTKRLEKLLFSDGDLPMIAKASAKQLEVTGEAQTVAEDEDVQLILRSRV